jgi:malonyl-ACP O-methyltransferase BioC
MLSSQKSQNGLFRGCTLSRIIDAAYDMIYLSGHLLRAYMGTMTSQLVAHAFDKAARSYDAAAGVQAQVAETLVATASFSAPQTILDIGCGTGLVLAQAAARWPDAELTGLDIAPAMLREAKQKMPSLTILRADAGSCDLAQRFDLIFSSMMLHWFPHPEAMLLRWRQWLTPKGVLCVAVPVAGSLSAWRDLCDEAGLPHGLWSFPPPEFADDLTCDRALRRHAVGYGSVLEFLRALKKSGGDTPREGHRPLSPTALRKLLSQAQSPFRVSYHVLYARIKGLQ